MNIDSKMIAYAEGYHDGRMEYEYNNIFTSEYYKQGYEDGLEDRSEQDEGN